ncbi:MAG TPA: iron-sulfur cluster assembly scaffold protein, partial [Solirubrobacteraceae bacterium]|nr:iron-sulfur cluster assembly scaffold protein [Solirubrobacteraceae bacterium]
MTDQRFAEHLEHPAGLGLRDEGQRGSAGGAPCGDLVTVELALDAAGRVSAVRFEAAGCGALTAAASAAVTLVEGEEVLVAARAGAEAIAGELGGLSPGKRHAADLVSDALH